MMLEDNFSRINKNNGQKSKWKKKDNEINNRSFKNNSMLIKHMNLIE